jgi:hypothetical protein
MVFAAAVYSTINSSYFICEASYYLAVGTSLSSTTPSFSYTCGSGYGGEDGMLTLTINKGYIFWLLYYGLDSFGGILHSIMIFCFDVFFFKMFIYLFIKFPVFCREI